MHIPTIRGVIDRHILVNDRVDPDALARCLPQPFRPRGVQGIGMAAGLGAAGAIQMTPLVALIAR
jgi:hypothetical protein